MRDQHTYSKRCLHVGLALQKRCRSGKKNEKRYRKLLVFSYCRDNQQGWRASCHCTQQLFLVVVMFWENSISKKKVGKLSYCINVFSSITSMVSGFILYPLFINCICLGIPWTSFGSQTALSSLWFFCIPPTPIILLYKTGFCPCGFFYFFLENFILSNRKLGRVAKERGFGEQRSFSNNSTSLFTFTISMKCSFVSVIIITLSSCRLNLHLLLLSDKLNCICIHSQCWSCDSFFFLPSLKLLVCCLCVLPILWGLLTSCSKNNMLIIL